MTTGADGITTGMTNGITKMTHRFYRVSRAVHAAGHPRLARFVAAVGRTVTNIEIPPDADLDPTVAIAHGQGLVLARGVKVGPRTILCQGVTLGAKNHGVPTVGADVIIYPGAKILGSIHIGDGARVGANAVVLHDVAAGDVVAGIPARSVNGPTGGTEEVQ